MTAVAASISTFCETYHYIAMPSDNIHTCACLVAGWRWVRKVVVVKHGGGAGGQAADGDGDVCLALSYCSAVCDCSCKNKLTGNIVDSS